MGSFNVHSEVRDLGLTSHLKDGISYSTVSPSLHWGIGGLFDQREDCPLLAAPPSGKGTGVRGVQLNRKICHLPKQKCIPSKHHLQFIVYRVLFTGLFLTFIYPG
uniref:Uncharacterized protein n=1 Tax=Anguilla anguilla TaxID=7936 RepID=A0A0E9S554_ANGAN